MATALLFIFQLRLHYCTWFDFKILLHSCIFLLSEVDWHTETDLHQKLCKCSSRIWRTLLYHPMHSRVCFSTPFTALYSRTSLNFSVTEYMEFDLQLNFPVLWQMRFHWNQWDPIATQNCSLLAQSHLEQGGTGSRWPVSSYAHLWAEAKWVSRLPPAHVIQNLNWKWVCYVLHTRL